MEKVIVKKNVMGHGYDTENVANFGTRHKFPCFYDKKIPKAGAELQKISEMAGITNLAVYDSSGGYDLNVKKATAFTWEELEPEIVRLLVARHDRLETPKP